MPRAKVAAVKQSRPASTPSPLKREPAPEAVIRLDTIHTNPKNPRRMSESAFSNLCKSISRDPEFMELRPIIVDADGMVLGGNMRLRGCLALKMETVPASWIKRATNLTPEKRRRFVLIDNEIEGMTGEWDLDILSADFDVAELVDIGFDEHALLADWPEKEQPADAEPQVDRAEELNKKWNVRVGDLFGLGAYAKCPKCGKEHSFDVASGQ